MIRQRCYQFIDKAKTFFPCGLSSQNLWYFLTGICEGSSCAIRGKSVEGVNTRIYNYAVNGGKELIFW